MKSDDFIAKELAACCAPLALAGREVFFATYTPRRKIIKMLRAYGREFCEAF